MEKTTTEEAIKLWKELKVMEVHFNFSCGGDSMNDTDLTIYADGSEQIKNDVLFDYFEDEVYKNVEFYVNSDGHYNGESGIVTISLDDEGFSYSKSSESEWSENHTETILIKLTDVEQDFVNKNLLNLNGEENNLEFVFKGDVFLTDEDEVFLEELETRIKSVIQGTKPNIEDGGELQEYYTFNTEENNLTINQYGEIEIEVNYSVTVFKED
jgi:hypothetical protein